MESIRDHCADIVSRERGTYEFSNSVQLLQFQIDRLVEETGIPAVPSG
jgi:hypothetical protein